MQMFRQVFPLCFHPNHIVGFVVSKGAKDSFFCNVISLLVAQRNIFPLRQK